MGGKRLKSNKAPRRNRHRNSSANRLSEDNSKETEIHGRPPIFLMPGLASTRLVSWSDKVCQHPLVSDIKMQDYIWLNVKVSHCQSILLLLPFLNINILSEFNRNGWNRWLMLAGMCVIG